jgi:arabinan endo-1,5-alpha-L-arabinosidase
MHTTVDPGSRQPPQRHGLAVATVAVAAWLAAASASAQPPPVHDPCLAEEQGFYVLFGTGRGVPMRRSRDLVAWERAGRVFDTPPAWAEEIFARRPPGRRRDDLWAPAIVRMNGRWHLYCAASIFGKNDSRIGLATNATLDPSHADYRWTDEGVVIESQPGRDDFNAIDAEVVFGDDGVPWLLFGSFFSGIKAGRLDAATGKLAESPPVLRTLARRPDEHAIENAAVIRRDGWWYLFASFDICCRGVESTYNVRVGRSRDLLGPYVDRDGRPMLDGGGTTILEGDGTVRGPGGASVFVEGGGRDAAAAGRVLLVHHFYDATRGGFSALQVRPLEWDAEGWPSVGKPLGVATGRP